jgi:hypothetical protein
VTANTRGILSAVATAVVLLFGASEPVLADAPLPRMVGGVRISRADAAAAVRVVRHALQTINTDPSLKRQPSALALAHTLTARLKAAWPLEEPMPVVFAEERPMQVFVALYGPAGTDLVAEGRGPSLLAALVHAACGLGLSERYPGGFDRLAQVRVSFDLTIHQMPYRANIAEPFLYSMRPGIDGLVYANGDRRSTVLPWEAMRRAWEMKFRTPEGQEVAETRPARTPTEVKKAVFRSLLERAGAQPATWRAPTAHVLRFETQAFAEDRPDGEVMALYRTGPVVRPESLIADDLAAAVTLATDYLARTPSRTNVVRDAFDPQRQAWNERFESARQALVVQALISAYARAKQPWMIKAARTLSEELRRELKRGTSSDSREGRRQCAFVVVGGKSELVWTAQVLVGLSALQGIDADKGRLDLIGELAGTLLHAQQEDGAFKVYFAPATDEKTVETDKEDLRGESLSLLALARAYEATGRRDLLKAARKTAEYLVFEREEKLGRAQAKGLSDPYLVEALSALDPHLANDALLRYAITCAEAIMAAQINDISLHPLDEQGGFLVGTTYADTEYASFCLRGLKALERAAARIEGAAAARYNRLGLALPRERLRQAIRRAEAFLLGLQYTEATGFYLAAPELAAGGLRHSACDGRISTVAVANFILAEED